MFDPRIFKLLKSTDPEERKDGVRALARTGEREALRYLATIYKEDADPGVRELALQAGQHIKKSLEAQQWVGDKTDSAPVASQPKSTVAPAVAQQSKKLMDQAMELMMKGNYEKAEEAARKAFKMNPDLQHDQYYSGIASEVMDMPLEEAIAELLR